MNDPTVADGPNLYDLPHMTAGNLRALLADFPPDMVLLVSSDPEGNRISPVLEIGLLSATPSPFQGSHEEYDIVDPDTGGGTDFLAIFPR